MGEGTTYFNHNGMRIPVGYEKRRIQDGSGEEVSEHCIIYRHGRKMEAFKGKTQKEAIGKLTDFLLRLLSRRI